ncbi:MAG: helix-turn-helix domain-containing protein [Oscillospiraceae bacterium]|nr:helix-turn-helix domain-containing protein [Oscillospiraceae bacterium]
MTYQERIRGLREDKDMTQKQVADLLGVAQTTYSQYELGKRPMPIDYLIACCKYYDVSADYILGFTNKNNPPEYR